MDQHSARFKKGEKKWKNTTLLLFCSRCPQAHNGSRSNKKERSSFYTMGLNLIRLSWTLVSDEGSCSSWLLPARCVHMEKVEISSRPGNIWYRPFLKMILAPLLSTGSGYHPSTHTLVFWTGLLMAGGVSRV